MICDNVLKYESIQPYLPGDNRFRVLLTTRFRLSPPVRLLEIEQLGEQASLELLQSLVKDGRIQDELESARSLCERLGYLPLALELMGRYLTPRLDLLIIELLEQLETQSLSIQALEQVEAGMTAQLGVASAFELSWQQLSPSAQQLSYLLSLFAIAPVNWKWVKRVCQWNRKAPASEGWLLEQERQLEEAQLDLYRSGLLKRVAAETYQLHQITHKFFRLKSQQFEGIEGLKGRYCQMLAQLSRMIPQDPTIHEIEQLAPLIPHLEFAAKHLLESYRDEDLIWAFRGISRFYSGKGLYKQAIPWAMKRLNIAQTQLGEENLDVADSLNDLAYLYHSQGRYRDAELLLLKALTIHQQQLGEEHRRVATSFNNLAILYSSQGRNEKAERLYLKALAIRQHQLGDDHPDVAGSLNSLAILYSSQRRYREAEPLYLQALAIRQQQLGKDHPDVAGSLNSLAVLYSSQRRYREAEPLYLKALKIYQQQLGEDHPDVADSLNNLAILYSSQGRNEKAEPLILRAISIAQQVLGDNHPSTILYRENLQTLQKQKSSFWNRLKRLFS